MAPESYSQAFLGGLYVESGPGEDDQLDERAELVFSDFLSSECGIEITRYQYGSLGEALAFSRSEYLGCLLKWIESCIESGDRNLIIYICGHGFISEQGFSLVTRDTDHRYGQETGLSLAYLYHLLLRFSRRARFLVIVDACMKGEHD